MTDQPAPPRAARVDVVRSHHGEDVTDPYEWLRDKTDPEVVAHLEAENAYTEARTSHLDGLRERVFTEIKDRVQQTDLSVPVRHRDWWYYSRTIEGEQYAVHGRVAVGESPERPELDPGAAPEGEQVLLDGNAEAQGEEFFSLGAFDVTAHGERLAYAVDTTGDERFDLRVKDLETGEVVDDAVTGIGYGTAWSVDGEHLFYTRVDDAWRPFQVWRHQVGMPAQDDVLVHQEDDERFWMGVGTSRDDRHVLIWLGSKNTSEVRLVDAEDPTGAVRVVAAREEGVEYDVEPAGDRLWIVHNRDHRDFALAVAPADSTSADDWSTVLPGEDGVRLAGVEAFAGHLVLSLRRDGLTQLQVLPLSCEGRPVGEGYQVPVDEAVYTIESGSNPTYDTDTLQVLVESMVTPRSVYDLDLGSGTLTLVKRQPVLGGYDPQDYQQLRLWATAQDGTRVPISLVARADLSPDGTHPGLLYGYGSYEISVDPHFSVSRLSYLDRGVVYAVAHVRGGGELGRGWYEDGRMERKTNTFTDFVACAEHLVATGWVAPDRLAAEGRSAGGLLMGAVLNLAPERFRVVHAGVAFVDALTTILDPSLPLTVSEWEEWGNPVESAQIYALMRSYTPYENIRPVDYPAILATTGLNDTRVYYVEPAKWVARLRETVTSDPQDRPILLKTEMVAGHGGKTGRYDAWRETAFEIAFVLDQLDATQVDATPDQRP
ncbi:oligopeptidase B [Serinicoccus sp. CUA-874]|uniref:S9 family peptidase n=1 Tax=Serinicoccus sp. CUA-874 TaxID=1517939 RepID=UPI0009594ABA|nr:S9 family peptidase [Serinicoccus sp. CUA-874]OLT14740.1 oligopeptidase B [Serinicoccus sp. CUA-874]